MRMTGVVGVVALERDVNGQNSSVTQKPKWIGKVRRG